MNIFHVPANLVDRLGWVLVHSAWQFALMALAALVLMHVTRRCSAASRYALLLLALAAMVASPIVTLLVMSRDEPMALATVDERAQASDARQGIAAAGAETEVARSRTRESSDGSLATSATTPVGASEAPADSWRTAVDQAVRPWLSVIVGIWCLGVLTFAWRPLLSWHTVRRLRRVGVSPVPAAVAAMLRQTSERLRLRQTVQILQSTLTRVPVVIGYLRPLILLPVSVIAGVPTSQLEAILAHELAHVRRHDFLVNLLQTLVETVFFYHPAVWWLSHRIRVERENCCDDLAVSMLGNRVEYGRALLAIEELRGTTTALALGARGGSLLDRVQRLFRRDPAERNVGAVGIVGVGLLAIVILAVGVLNSTLAEKPHSPPDAQAARAAAAEREAWDALDALNVTVYGEAANRWTLKSQIKNLERTKFPENAIRDLREQLERPVHAADFWNVPAEAWTHIGRLTSLQELRVVGSDLRGKPMDEIGRLTNLRKLTVTNSKCNPQDLAPLRGLADLEHLEVMCTVFEESGAWRKEQLGELTAEEQAVVARCVAVGPNRESMAEAAILTDRVLASLGGLHRLRTLRLWNTYLSGRGLESLKTLPAIEELDLTLIEFTPETARIVGGLRTLKRFRYANVTDESLAELAGLSELEDLHVWARGVTDRSVDHLLKLSKLKKLAILGSQLSDAGLQRLASLPHLESLDLSFSGPPTTYGVKPIQEPLTAAGVKRFQEQRPECKVTFEQKVRGAEPVEQATDVTQPAPAVEAVAQPPRDASLDVVVQIPDAAYTRPTADDQRATATIPAEAWGKPVDGLRLAIVLRSPPIDKVERLCYDIVAENVSDHDIRFSAEVGIDTWHFFFKAKLADADGKQVEQQRGFQTRLGPRLVRFWLKPKERSVISSWATKLLKLDDEGKPLASPEEYRGPSSFSVKPGRYSLSAAMDLGPIVHSVDPVSEKRTVLSPAKGEWSGKLQTGAVPVALFTDPAPADEGAAKPPRDASLDVVAQIPDAEYTRPTADDQRATATIPAEAWGEPVNGLRVAIALRSPPVDEVKSLRYDIVAENVSDHDIRFLARLGVDDWHNSYKTQLVDANGEQVALQEGTVIRQRPRLIRTWLKPKERSVISSWASGLFKQDEEARPKGYRGPRHFNVNPGQHSVSAEVELGPSMYSTDPVSKKRTVLSPAKGEWSGKLQTGVVPVALFTQPAPAVEGAEPTRVTFVIAQHVILHDGKIVTWEEVDKILDEAAKAGKIYPQFYSTNGGLPREEELRGHRSQLYKKLYDAGKIDGMSVGSLSPRSGEYLDRIKTPADLVPDESTKQAGRVLDVGGQPLADVEVFPLPAEHVNGVYLRDGRNRNPLEERITRSDRDGKVVIFPEPSDMLIAAVHPNGFAITTLAEFKEQMGRLQLQPWARVTGQRPAEGDDAQQSVDFTCYPVPGLSFHIYETEIAKDGRFDQKFVPPGKVIVSRSLSTGQGVSMSFTVETIDLLPGQSHKVPLGPIPDDAKAAIKDAEARRRQAEPEPKPADQSTDASQSAPAVEAVAKQSMVPAPPIESRKAVAAARQALLVAERDKHKHPPIEFRIAASKADRDADGVAWFPITDPRIPAPAEKSGANVPIEEKLDEKWRGLLWDKAEHALLADGTWRVVKCEVARSEHSTELVPSFEIRITLDAAGGALLRRLASTHLNQSLAIVVDGTIISTPVIIEPFGEDFVITGTFTREQADKLAATIRGGNADGGQPLVMTEQARIVPLNDLEIRVQRAGTIVSLKVGVGASVKKNDVLAVVNNAESAKPEDIVAPLDGEVVKVFVRDGEQVKAGQGIVRIVQLDRVLVESELKLADLSPRGLIGKVEISLNGKDMIECQGKVTFIDPQADANGNHRIRVEVENRKQDGKWLLVPGQKAKLTILRESDGHGRKEDQQGNVPASDESLLTLFALRFVDAKLALAALKTEADIREIVGFKATIDPRRNSILIIADADTLKAVREILNRLDSANAPSAVLAPADLGLEHDGKEVTMIFKITDTQLIAGEREGEFPHVMLHYEGMKKPPYLGVYVKGELADVLHRSACVAPDDKLVGRSIKVSGKIKIHTDFPKGEDPTPVYHLDLRDWKKFQILPEPKGN